MRKYLLLLATIIILSSFTKVSLTSPTPSLKSNKAQKAQIKRKYGMFIHFGINTFHDMEWTDGSKPASSYKPTAI